MGGPIYLIHGMPHAIIWLQAGSGWSESILKLLVVAAGGDLRKKCGRIYKTYRPSGQ